jgi:hypothetical protein
VIGGIALATHEPFTGIALTIAAAYTIVKSYKTVHEKLMKALNKSNSEAVTNAPSNIENSKTSGETSDVPPPVVTDNHEEPPLESKKGS